MYNPFRSTAGTIEAGKKVARSAYQEVVESAHEEKTTHTGPEDRPFIGLILETGADGVFAMRPGDLVRNLRLVRDAVGGTEDANLV